jgi:predicted nucleic acid-binding Zn ribbon protein
MSDDPVVVCEVCSKPVERVFHPIAVHFKGSGFYTTDYAKKKTTDTSTDTKKPKTSESSSNGSKPDSSD